MGLKKIIKNATIIALGLGAINYATYGISTLLQQHCAETHGNNIAKHQSLDMLEGIKKFQKAFPIGGKILTYGMEKAAENCLQE